MQDLTLILSTKNHQTKQTKKKKTRKNSSKQEFKQEYYRRSGEGFIVKNICCTLLPATTSLKMPFVKKICCVLLQLSFMMKICCVLLPAPLGRRYSCVLLVHLLCTFINVFIIFVVVVVGFLHIYWSPYSTINSTYSFLSCCHN